MIYDPVAPADAICQGDIFKGVPRVEVSFRALSVVDVDDEEEHEETWKDVREAPETRVIAAVRPVNAIVVSQTCDIQHAEFVYLAQLFPLLETLDRKQPESPNSWRELIQKVNSGENPRFFYLPPSDTAKLDQAMTADFRVILRIPRPDLDELKNDARTARLKEVALDHLREKFSYFYRRYAFNNWYPLDREQFKTTKKPETEAYPWQR